MTYGASPSSDISEIANAKFYVTFGHNPAVTRGSGHGKSWQMTCTREAEGGRKPKMIVIDPIYSDTAVAHADEWIPIRPGTDAALVEAIAHELIVHDRVDHAFLAQYCVGYDEGTLPASAPKGSDYKSHILGRGPDGIEKTPEWASRITGVPVETIVRLAEEIGTTKPVFFSQGWGPQRQANGEQTSRAIAMLPILMGNVGLPGTSTGQQEGNTAVPAVYLPVGTNPVKATIPCFLWTDAIVRGREMDDVHDGLRGVKTLGHDIKMIVNSGGNTLINQHSDSNRTDEILRDTSKCEFIVVCDNMMTPSARYADILLPDTLGPEADDVTASGGSNGDSAAILPLHKAVEPQWEQRPTWEICRGIARHLGKEEAFTEGKTQLEWIEWCYNETRRKIPSLPDFATFWKTGPAHIHDLPNAGIALEAFRKDPKANPLKTPSGRIEIYSECLANIAKNWVLPKGDVISPIPMFVRTWEMPGDTLQKKYPLQCYGYHGHGRIHSTFHNLPALREQFPDEVLVNVLDADARGIRSGDRVLEEVSGSWRQDRMTGAWHQDVRAWYVSIACNHCENPACVKVCPTKAHYKRAEDGLVVIDRDKCIGCGMCAQACPYGAPQLDEKARKMMKCDGCLDRLEKGGAPICVEACPQRAISFGEISELRRTFGTLAVTPPLPDPAQTRPALVIVPSPKAK